MLDGCLCLVGRTVLDQLQEHKLGAVAPGVDAGYAMVDRCGASAIVAGAKG